MKRFLLRLLLVFVIGLVVLPLGGLLWLHTSLPIVDGRLSLPGVAAEVRVTRDALGIPTITAASDRDAAFALGYLHAQDRLFAMDSMRHFGSGRVSEWAGPRALDLDRAMRTLGLYRSAAQQLAELPAGLTEVLEAYAAGVNAFIAGRQQALPPEYYLLGTRPEPWTPTDSLVWGKIMDLGLTGNYRGEILRARLLQHLSPDVLSILFPPYPGDGPVTIGSAALFKELPLDALAAKLPDWGGPQRASNNWVVDGRHSASGKPLLANDPHLDYGAPSVWYLARLKTPAGTLAGVTAPGTPFVVIGHNDHIAWGFTTTGSDVQDLFIEKPDPDDAGRYLTPDGSAPFEIREETISVRGGAPVTVKIRSTRHGPVISDLASTKAPEGELLALQSTWLGSGDDRTPAALWGIAHATDWDGFREALKDWVAPEQNIVFADTTGTVGFIAPARIPIRPKADGWLPVPGWTAENDWTGYLPFAALPSAVNPTSGHFVSANNKIVPDSYPYFLTRDWDVPDRAQRITDLLEATPVQTMATTAAIQRDTLSWSAQQLLPLMTTGVTAGSPEAAAALDRLRGWDGHMDRDAVSPLLFVAWLREFSRAVLTDKLGNLFPDYWGVQPDHGDTTAEVMRLVLAGHRDWCKTAGVTAEDGCPVVLSAALDAALLDLRTRYGSDMSRWRWGAAHVATFNSQIWDAVPILRNWIDKSVPADGGIDTVNAGVYRYRSVQAPYTDLHGPTLRMIVDMADPAAARFMISPGEAGNPMSPHYADLMTTWRDGDTITFRDDTSGGTLVLAPP